MIDGASENDGGAPPSRTETLRMAGLLAGLVLLFFSPALLGGRLLAPARGDGLAYYYAVRVHAAELASGGRLPSWSPAIFGGFPLLADVEAGLFYPPNWLFLVLPPPVAMNTVVLLAYFVAGFAAYLYARALGTTPLGGTVAALTFMLSGFMVSHLGHVTIIEGAAWLPLLLYFLERQRNRFTWSFVLGASLTLAMQVLGGHPQVVVHSLMLAGLHVVFFGVLRRPPAGRRAFLLAAGGSVVLAALLCACQILPTFELASRSFRTSMTYESFTDYSLPPSHLLIFLFPHLFGGSWDSAGRDGWWSVWSSTELVGYVGLTPILLALLALPRVKRSIHTRFWILAAALFLILALGGYTPAHRLLYHVPGYNLFRSSSRHLLQVDLALAVLAGLGTTLLARREEPRSPRSAARAAGAVVALMGGFCLLVLASDALAIALLGVAPPDPRTVFTLTNPALWRPLVTAAGVGGAWWIFARRPEGRARLLAIAVVLADLGFFGWSGYWRVLSPTQKAVEQYLPAVAAVKKSDPETSGYRILSYENEQNGPLLHRVQNAGGSSSLAPARYLETLGGMDSVGAVLDSTRLLDGRALDLLSVRYLVVPHELLAPAAIPSWAAEDLVRDKFELKLSRRRLDQAELPLPPVRCSAITVTAPSAADLVPEGEPLLRLVASTKTGSRIERVLRSAREMRATLGAREEVTGLRLELLASAEPLKITELAFEDAATGHVLRFGRRAREDARFQRSPRYAEAAVHSIPGSALSVVSSLSQSLRIPQGTPVARLEVWTTEGQVVERLLRAGEDTSEWAWDRLDVRLRVRHRRARVIGSFAAGWTFHGHRYQTRVELGGRHRVEKVVLEYLPGTGRLDVFELSLLDEETMASTPLRPDRDHVEPEPPAWRDTRPLEWTFAPVRGSALEVVSALENATSVRDGEPVAKLSVWTAEGPTAEKVLRAGEDLSEWAWDRPDVAAVVAHRKASVAESFPGGSGTFEGHRYLSRFALGGAHHVQKLRLTPLTPRIGFVVTEVSLLDEASGLRLPLYRRDAPIAPSRPSLPLTLTGDRTTDSIELAVSALPTSAVVVLSALRHSVSIEQGEAVAKVSVWTDTGARIERLMRAGEHTSEWAWEVPEVRGQVRHAQAPIAEVHPTPWAGSGRDYLARLEIGGLHRVTRLRIDYLAAEAMLSITGIGFHDARTGLMVPLPVTAALLGDESRWRPLFEAGGRWVYENLRALPRAWLVPVVRALPGPDVLKAIHAGTLPDGSEFDPRLLALVEEGEDQTFGPLDGDARVEILRAASDRLTLRSRSRTPAFLVLSEVFYPGWRATLDGAPAAIRRVDYVLRGLALPAGEHRIELAYEPTSLRIGLAVSAAALLGVLGIRRASRRPEAAAPVTDA